MARNPASRAKTARTNSSERSFSSSAAGPDLGPSEARSLYDLVPYPGHPFAQTHPDRLATLATLFGLEPPALERCRVLELGCGDAGNLAPMAAGLPDARFVGVDAASGAVARGRAMAEALGLTNVTLEVGAIEG